ncbi:hypothetical protein BJ170DRAFT_608112 [Xylariales sp. AK1849]|nr:hypothetical protein BJ170DRAFT_608112 [Xylariales sp. AK1849]
MAPVFLGLELAIGLLMVVSVIELGFISSTVGWLHQTGSKGFAFEYNNSVYILVGTPSCFLVDQGHTSNGAAGTASILIGLGGIIALWLRNRSQLRGGGLGFTIYYIWLALQVPALLLTIGALGYVFAVTNAHEGQIIDVALATGSSGSPYPLDTWTPQNWFSAVLELDLISGRDDILSHLRLMTGWQYNLIPFFIIQLFETALAFVEFSQWRRGGKVASHSRV